MKPVSMLLLLVACHTTETEPEPVTTDGMADFYEQLQEDALLFGYENGQWTEDFGDAAAFGPTFYAHAGQQLSRVDYLTRAEEAATYNRSVLVQASDDMAWLSGHLEEVFMATQGAITWSGILNEPEPIAEIDALIDTMDPIVQATGDYMNLSLGDFASDLYGPTALTGGVAVIYLQHAHYLHADRSQEWLARAIEITAAIDGEALHNDHYRFSPDTEKLYLYPNAIMLLVLNRLYQQTEDVAYLAQAEAVFQGIQPLWDSRMELYHSPYSTESQGAQTDEYSTLSSQNYLLLGLMEMYRNTGDEIYRNEVVRLLQSIRTRLYSESDRLLVHHWVDGRPAGHDDPDFFCSGCNLQTLFILWYLENELGVVLK